MIFTTIYLAGWLSVFAPLFSRSRNVHRYAWAIGHRPWVADAVMALVSAAWPAVWASIAVGALADILARGDHR